MNALFRRLAFLASLLAALFLPLQVSAAWLMPLCAHAATSTEPADPTDSHSCHETADSAAQAFSEQPIADPGNGCDNCGSCHMAGSAFLPTLPSGLATLPLNPSAAPAPLPFTLQFLPDGPLRPPRTAA